MYDHLPRFNHSRRNPGAQWTSHQKARGLIISCIVLALFLMGCSDTGISQEVSGQQTLVTPLPTRTSQPLWSISTFVARRITETIQPAVEIAAVSSTETPIIPTDEPTVEPIPTEEPTVEPIPTHVLPTLAPPPGPNPVVAPPQNEPTPTAARPADAAATCPAGVCVTQLVVSDSPKHNQPITFTATFLNSAGAPKQFDVIIRLFAADSNKGFGESPRKRITVPPGTSQGAISYVAVRGPGPCTRFYARAAAHQTATEKPAFLNTDGRPLSTYFDVC